jgi:hypothetical protein
LFVWLDLTLATKERYKMRVSVFALPLYLSESHVKEKKENDKRVCSFARSKASDMIAILQGPTYSPTSTTLFNASSEVVVVRYVRSVYI